MNRDLNQQTPFVTYIAKENETLEQIIDRFNVPLQSIYDYNTHLSKNIRSGTPIRIPLIPNDDIEIYIVERGVDLSDIARKFKTTTSLIKEINGLKSEQVYIGDVLVIQKKYKKSYDCYMTEEYDTIQSMLIKHNITLIDLLKNNPNLFLIPNQVIKIEKKIK